MTYQEWHQEQTKKNPFFQFIPVDKQHAMYSSEVPKSEEKLKGDFMDMFNQMRNAK